MKVNQAQSEAITFKDGPMLVLAGPGSGKTFVITQRLKYLVTEQKIAPESILVVTFSRMAAEEMKERYLRLTGESTTAVSFGTFHSIFFNILRRQYGLGTDNIVREDEKRQLLSEALAAAGLETQDETELLDAVSAEISMIKNCRPDFRDYQSTSCLNKDFFNIYKNFSQQMYKKRLIDFDDILLLSYKLLLGNKGVLECWQQRFQYILIDEFQDINRLQYDTVRLLAAPQNNLFCVGDDDQSIYGFRGAQPGIMQDFIRDFEGAGRILLNYNYRSDAHIVERAGKLISNNIDRFDKEIQPSKDRQHAVIFSEFDSLEMQNTFIADRIKQLHEKGMDYGDIAILIRVNTQARMLLNELLEKNIPFYFRDGVPGIYEHWITRDILDYVRLATGNRERKHILGIINRPVRYIKRAAFAKEMVNFSEVCDYYRDKPFMKKRVEEFFKDIGFLARLNPYAAVCYILDAVGYKTYVRDYAASKHIRFSELEEVMEEIKSEAKRFGTHVEWLGYADEIKKKNEENSRTLVKKCAGAVNVLTFHASKGLEFNTVFIPDVNEGFAPHRNAISIAEVEEERRMFYVAMTRAKDKLFLLSTQERMGKPQKKSRFIAEAGLL